MYAYFKQLLGEN